MRLKLTISLRIDERVRQRVDASDIVQERLIEASRRLPDYIRTRPIPFYPWLRQSAWDRIMRLHQQHIGTRKRSVTREAQCRPTLSEASVDGLMGRLASKTPSPSECLAKKEYRTQLRTALEALPCVDREVLMMFHLERLSITEIAAVLDLTDSGVKSRHRRALLRLTEVLESDPHEY